MPTIAEVPAQTPQDRPSAWRTIPLYPMKPGDTEPHPHKGFTGWAGQDLPVTGAVGGWAIGCPLDASACIIDIDHYGAKTGRDRITALEAFLGDLPPSVKITSRGPDDPGGKFPYRIPAGTVLRGDICTDVDIIQKHHRFTWAPGMIHPKNRALVRVYAPDGTECGMPPVEMCPWLPENWLAFAVKAPETGIRRAVGDTPEPTDHDCTEAISYISRTDFSDASKRGNRAGKAVKYLAILHDAGHPVGTAVEMLRDALPDSSEIDDMWDTMQVSSTAVPVAHCGCFPDPLAALKAEMSTPLPVLANKGVDISGTLAVTVIPGGPVPLGSKWAAGRKLEAETYGKGSDRDWAGHASARKLHADLIRRGGDHPWSVPVNDSTAASADMAYLKECGLAWLIRADDVPDWDPRTWRVVLLTDYHGPQELFTCFCGKTEDARDYPGYRVVEGICPQKGERVSHAGEFAADVVKWVYANGGNGLPDWKATAVGNSPECVKAMHREGCRAISVSSFTKARQRMMKAGELELDAKPAGPYGYPEPVGSHRVRFAHGWLAVQRAVYKVPAAWRLRYRDEALSAVCAAENARDAETIARNRQKAGLSAGLGPADVAGRAARR